MNKYKSRRIENEREHLLLAMKYCEKMQYEFESFEVCCKRHYDSDDEAYKELFELMRKHKRDMRLLGYSIEIYNLLYDNKESD